MTSIVAAYALFLPIGLDSSYALAMLPTFLLGGLGFALAFGPLNIAATNGIAPEEQGLAGGLLNTSFQFGGALVLAVVTAVEQRQRGNRRLPAGPARRLPRGAVRLGRRRRPGCRCDGVSRRERASVPVAEEILEEAA